MNESAHLRYAKIFGLPSNTSEDEVLKLLDENLCSNFCVDECNHFLGLIYFENGQSEKALDYIQKVPRESSYYNEALFHTGLLELKKKNI